MERHRPEQVLGKIWLSDFLRQLPQVAAGIARTRVDSERIAQAVSVPHAWPDVVSRSAHRQEFLRLQQRTDLLRMAFQLMV